MKRAAANAKKLGYVSSSTKNDNKPYNKRNPNNYNGDRTDSNNLDLTSVQSRKQRLKEKLKIKQLIQKIMILVLNDIKHSTKTGWLLNIVETIIPHNDSGSEQSGLDLYFIEDSGETFKATIIFYPYFYIYCDEIYGHSMEQFLRKI